MKPTAYKKWLSIMLSILMVLMMIPVTAVTAYADDGVAIDETNFPDGLFRDYVRIYFDLDGDGFLNEAEIAAVTEIDVSSLGITSVKGVEFFTSLEKFICRFNILTELDVSRNTALTYLSCSNNQLTELDVSRNTALTYLGCAFNQLTELDVSENVDLEDLQCQINQLNELDISHNPRLTSFSCESNNLTELDLTNNTSLEWIWCDYNQLEELDVSMCTALTFLCCGENLLTTLDVSHNHALTELDCPYSLLTELNVNGCEALERLCCWYNDLSDLDVSSCTSLKVLQTLGNPLTELDVSNNYALEELICYYNTLISLDLSHNPALKILVCECNYLTELDVSHNPELTYLDCCGNNIPQLDISSCPFLNDVYFNGERSERSFVDPEFGRIDYYQFFLTSHHQLLVDKATEIISSDSIDRIAGKDRFLTAIEAADRLKAELGGDAFSNIVIASGTDFPDALAGAYLAVKKDAPVLLTNAGFAPAVAEYAKNNLKAGGTVYILGGTGAVPEVMETELQKQGITNIERLAGSDRYKTNIEILKEAGVEGQDLLICSGTGYADSLSASALGKPILLVGKTLTKDQMNEVDGVLSGSFYTLGGTGAVSDEVFDLVNVFATREAERVAGSDRFATSAAIAEKFMPDTVETAVLAYAMNYPDGLAGGPVAYATGSPLLLVTDNFYSDAASYVKQAGIKKFIIMGGEALISYDTALAMML